MGARTSLLRNWMKRGIRGADAEDIVQEGILRGLMNIDKFKGKSALKTWLIAVGKNEGCSYIRKQVRQDRIKRRVTEVIDVATTRRQSGRRRPLPPSD